jgi:hypothetical protein
VLQPTVLAGRRKGSAEIMKKTRTAKKPRKNNDEMLREYRLDYSKVRPNRFAARLKPGSRVVVIEPDVAEGFATPESVNTVLRALIETMPRNSLGSISQGRTNG